MKKTILLFLFLIPHVSTSNQVQDWVYISSDSAGLDYYYSPERIKLSNGSIIAWLKESPSSLRLKDYRLELISSRKSKNLKITGYESYSHTLTKVEFDCKNNRHRLIAQYDYSTKGEVLESFTIKYQEWVEVVPESVFEAVINYLCALK